MQDNAPSEASARADALADRAQRYRERAAKAGDPETARRLRRMARQLDSEAAIERARAALRHGAPNDAALEGASGRYGHS